MPPAMARTLSIRVTNQLSTPPETTACQKLMILWATGTFIALAALTASLPFNRRSFQDADSASKGDYGNGTTAPDTGNTAWMIVATILGTMLTPAVAYLYNNMYGRSSSLLVEVVTITSAMIATLWIVISFSLVHAKDANGDGILGFPKYYYMFAHTYNSSVIDGDSIPGSIFAVFELAFATLTPAIVASAVIDRVNVYGFLTFIFVWHLCIYAPIAHITWFPTGFFRDHDILDFSGGIVVNMLSSITVLATHLFLNWKGAPKSEPRAPTDPKNLLFNTIIVWFLWFGINAGKAHSAGAAASQSIVNTIGGTMTSILINHFIDMALGVEQNDFTLINPILFGLVATTPSSGVVTVGGSMVIVIIVTLATRIIANGFMGEAHNSQYSIATIHGLAGSIGFLMTALICVDFVNPYYSLDGLTNGIQTPIRHHLAVVLAMWSAGFLSVLLCLFVTNLFVTLGRPEQSGKGDYAPTPVGPFKANQNIEHNEVYKHESTFDAEPTNAEAPAAAEGEGAEEAVAPAENA